MDKTTKRRLRRIEQGFMPRKSGFLLILADSEEDAENQKRALEKICGRYCPFILTIINPAISDNS